jgi:hypothetical protein
LLLLLLLLLLLPWGCWGRPAIRAGCWRLHAAARPCVCRTSVTCAAASAA